MSDVSEFEPTKAREVIDEYLEAYQACQETLYYCEQEGGDYAEALFIRQLHDASEMSLTAANFLMRGSPFYRPLLELAGEILQSCAESIEAAEEANDQFEVAYVACLRARQATFELIDPERHMDDNDQDKTLADSFPASDPPATASEL